MTDTTTISAIMTVLSVILFATAFALSCVSLRDSVYRMIEILEQQK